MILVDTSVWISHLREGNPSLEKILGDGEVACHAFVIGELACGNLKRRSEILSLLRELPQVIEVDYEEALQFLERNRLFGKGLGFIDVHLLASALLTGVPLWTLDRKLGDVAHELGIGVDKKSIA